MYVVIRKAEKRVLYAELVATTECRTLQSSCCTNRVQLYFIAPFASSLTSKLQCWAAYSTGNEVTSINAQNNQEYTH
jgi:hypothetical protein